MTDSKALIERLRQLSRNTGKMTWVGDKPMTARDALTRAADYIEKLEADNARLREGLEKIVALEDDFESNAAMTAHEWQMFHTARAALAGDSHDQ